MSNAKGTHLKGSSSYNTGFAKFDNTRVLDDNLDSEKFWLVATFLIAIGISIFSLVYMIQINMVIAVIFVISSWVLFMVFCHKFIHAKKIRKQVRNVNKYLEKRSPGIYEFSEIQKGINIQINSKERKRIFNVINQMPQYDASLNSNTIVKRM